MPITPEQEQQLIAKYSTANPLGQVLQSVQYLPQDTASKILKYATQSGDSAQNVANNLHVYERDVVDLIDWEDVSQKAPRTSAFLSDPVNMAVARNKENIQMLKDAEVTSRNWESVKNGFKGIGRSFVGMGLAMNEKALKTAKESAEAGEQYDPVTFQPMDQHIQGLEREVESLRANLKSPTLTPKEFTKNTLGQKLWYGVLETAPQIAAQMAMYAATGGIGSAAFMAGQIQGGQYADLREKGVDSDRAAKASVANAAIQAPLEKIGLGRVFKAFKPGSTAVQKAWDIAERMATEGATEFLQQYPEEVTNIVAKNPGKTNAEYTKMFMDDFINTTKEGLLQAAIAAPFGLIGGAGKLALEKEHTEVFIAQMEEVQQQIAQSDLIKKSPELVEKHLDLIYGDQKVYVDPEGLVLYQKENPKVLDQLGITKEQVQSAVETNEMVEVDFGKYEVAAALNPQIHEALKDDIAPEETGATKRIIQERDKIDVEKATERLKQQDSELQSEVKNIHQSMIDAGVDKSVARNAAALLSRHASTMSDNPAQWLRDNAPTFQKATDAQKPGLMQKVKGFFHGGKPKKTQALDKDGFEIETLDGTPIYTNPDGTITLYHKTSAENAKNIFKKGFAKGRENTGEVFLSSKPNGQIEGYGDTLVTVDVNPQKVRVDDVFKDEVHVAVDPKYITVVKDRGSSFAQGLYQGENTPNGMIQWNEGGRAIITLFENADTSTLVHEMVGHYFIQNLIEQGGLEAATEQMQKDRKTALEWAGIENWETATDEQKVDAHEKLARAAERYLLEGVAPTRDTRGVFNRFKNWLIKIYKSAEAIGVEINDEIRGVFDRMIISQEEILEQEVLNNYYQQLPADVLETLTNSQRAELDKAILDARERAESQLRGQLMRFISADNKIKMAEERQAATERISQEVAGEKLYQTAEQIKKDFGREAKAVAKSYNDGTLRVEKAEDVHFEYLAEQSGYSSGSELAHHLLNNNAFEQEVKARVNEYMKQFRDVLTDPGTVKQEAQESMYSDDGALVIAMEQQIINEKLGQILDKAEAHKQAVQAREMAKRAAKDVMGKRPIEQAIKLQSYIANERRAAQRAAKALAKGDMQEAQEQKRIQFLNHAMVQESLRIKREYERINKYLKRQQKSDMKTWRKEEHFAQAADLLRRFGFARKDAAAMTETLDQWAQRMAEDMDTVSIASWLTTAREAKPKDLTIAQLKDVENAVRNIKRVAQTENTFFRLFDKAIMEDAITQAEGLLKDRKDVYTPAVGKDERSVKQRYLYSLKKITTMLHDMDKSKDFGFFYKLIYEKVYDAQNKLSARMHELKKCLDNAYAVYTKKERADMGTKQIFFPELGASITKEQLLQIAFNVGNNSSREVLFSVAPVGLEKSPLWQGKPEENEVFIMGFLGKALDARDWKFVQDVWDIVNSLFADADAMHKEMSGFSMDKVESTPFNVTLTDGSTLALRGGYYPLEQDPRIRNDTSIDTGEPLYTEKSANFVGTNKGYTYSRTGAKYPIKLTGDTTFRHLTQVAHDIEFRPVITDLRRLILNRRFADLVESKMGLEGYALLRDFVGAAANTRTGVTKSALDTLDKIANFARKRAVVSQMLGRIGVIVQNIANPFLFGKTVEGFSHVDAARAFFARGVFSYWPQLSSGKARQIRDFVFSKSQFMRDKTATPDYILHELEGQEGPVVKFFTMLLAEADNLTNIPMWVEAYQKQIDAGATEHDAVMYADTIVDRSTGSGRKIDTPRILRGTPTERLFAMYKSFMLTQYNAWAMEAQIFLKDKDVMRLVTQVAAKYILFVVASMALTGKFGDDDKEKDLAKKIEGELISYPLGFFPVFGDMVAYMYKRVRGLESFNYRLTPVEGMITDIINAPVDVVKAATTDKKTAAEATESVSKVVSYAVPYPDQFNDWFWNAYDMLVNDMDPEAKDVMKRRTKRER